MKTSSKEDQIRANYPEAQAGEEISWFSKQKAQQGKKQHGWLYKIGIGLLVVILLLFFIPVIQNWQEIVSLIKEANKAYLLVATIIFCFTFVLTGFAMTLLAEKKMPLKQTSLIQLSMAFTYKIFPAGLGGPGLMYRYAVVAGYSLESGLGYVGAVELTYFTAWLLYFIPVVVIANPGNVNLLENVSFSWKIIFLVAFIAVAAYVILRAFHLLATIKEKIKEVWRSLSVLMRRPGHSLVGLMFMLLSYTATNVTFYLCLRSVGINIGFINTLFVYLLFNSIGSCGPAPGGMGTVEAALVFGLTLFGVDPTVATTGVLIFRLLTFYLPTFPGWFAFRYGIKQKFI